jgi:RNA polymerase sigma-70 factor (ECF subfamily)
LSQITAQTEQLVEAGAARLIARATNARLLDAATLVPRLRAALEKYLLRDDPHANAQAVNQFMDTLYADDLCLIIACERGDQLAWNDLVERYGATVKSAARHASSNEDAAEDVAQSIWAELYGLRAREDGKPSGKLAYYSGRGSLGGWLRAVVGQLAVDQHRKQGKLVQPEEDADFDRLARESREGDATFGAGGRGADPEDALADARAARDVSAALSRAIGELDAEDRLLVRLYYFDGLRLREAGAVLGVHEATASRRLTKVHAEVRRRVEVILMKEHGWTQGETTRSLSEVATHLETDMEVMLSREALAGENPARRGE